MTERSELYVCSRLYATAFSANGEHLVRGDAKRVRVWRVEDAKPVATLQVPEEVACLAVSKDGGWLCAGTSGGYVVLWRTRTFERVLVQDEDGWDINAVDFSPDSARLVSASDNYTATIWDVASRKHVQTLQHLEWVRAAKYSRQGDRIATATGDRVRVWDSNDACLLLEIPVKVTPWFNRGLLWSGNHLFVVSDWKIRQLDTSSGSTVSEWPALSVDNSSYIGLPKHRSFVACSTNHTITFWDTSTHSQLGLLHHPQRIHSIVFSPDDRFIAIGEKDGKYSIKRLSRTIDGAATSDATQHNNPPTRYVPPPPRLRDWTETTLVNYSWKATFRAAAKSTVSRITIYQVLCERLEAIDRITDAAECFYQMTTELGREMDLHAKHLQWAFDFKQRSCAKSEHLGNAAVDAQRPNDAISHFSVALSLQPRSPQDILIKRSKAFLATRSWKQALDDANQAIALDPSLPWGYQMKHAALHQAGDYDNAINAYEAMLSKMAQSPDPSIRRHCDQYISPSSTRATIRRIAQKIVRRLPRELINTTDGHLYNRAEHASAFESVPIFNELVSSVTTRTDYGRIKREVRQYFRYVMLSHKWEDNEPSFQQVIRISVYDLDQSPTHIKLQTFCKIVRHAGFIWAWSDTVCINKSDHFVLQEALIAMFEWYKGSALTVVYLRGVGSLSHRGALMKSVWNTRAWTLQEYIAAKVVHFYTEDWTPYLGLQLPNHKQSRQVISEMEEATGVSAEELMALRPGLSSIREKLCLASTRKTTLVEDTAYSLLSIFSATGIPAIYGEGNAALGRLLANLLTRSGDTNILAWTGEPGRFNSCLPARIAVFNAPVTSHLPTHIFDAEMATIIASHTSPYDLDAALRLRDRLYELPTPRFAESRLTLPCITFRLPCLRPPYRVDQIRVYRVDTDAFGMVEIRTKHDLSSMGTLYLAHPWLGTLLEHEDVQNSAFDGDDVVPPRSPSMGKGEVSDEEINDEHSDDSSSVLQPELTPLSAPVRTVPMDRETRARRLVARLRQPFGALLFRLTTVDRRVVGYKRVAADSAINVQFRENFPLAKILDGVCTIDVL